MRENAYTNRTFEESIRARDNYQCQFCWRKETDGVELRICQVVADEGEYRRPSNYQLLCNQHYQMVCD